MLLHGRRSVTPHGLLMIAAVACSMVMGAGPAIGTDLPSDHDRGSDQQHEKDRQQHRRYQPLTKLEFLQFGHDTAFRVEAGAQHSQSPITAEGRAAISDM